MSLMRSSSSRSELDSESAEDGRWAFWESLAPLAANFVPMADL